MFSILLHTIVGSQSSEKKDGSLFYFYSSSPYHLASLLPHPVHLPLNKPPFLPPTLA